MSKGRVGIAALKLVDPKTRQPTVGERWEYAASLSRFLVEMGYDVAWWQLGDGWRAEVIPGVPLFGLLPTESSLVTWPKASNAFLEKAGRVDFAIYFDAILGYPQVHETSIAIAHSIDWDDPMFESMLHSEDERQEWRRRLWMALQGPEKVVAGETGVIQWATATWPNLHHKFVYIPNFVPRAASGGAGMIKVHAADHRPVRVIFPNPLVPAEGISEAVQAMQVLLSRHADIEFYVTGSGPDGATRYMEEWSKTCPRVVYDPHPIRATDLEDMDIFLFPAKHGQGTSMACLQAMAAGKCVIVGQTGGLTDLVLHEHNGIVIQPTAERIVQAVEAVVGNPAKRDRLGRNAQEVAGAFTLQRWKQRWRAVLDRVFR